MLGVTRGSNRRFGDADDLADLGIVVTAVKATEVAQREVDSIMSWAESNAVAFDLAKVGVLYLLRLRARHTDLPPITNGDIAIRESKTARWPGVLLERGPTFCNHVAEWT